ncbi:MAG TPA: hypothetical protein VIK01_16770, partial [Polyangiaceae bacterium]
ITELVTGLDLVKEMVRVAEGKPLAEGNVARRGAAIEARLYAEDPAAGFLPSPGKISLLRPASGPFLRDDSGIFEGGQVSASYDPLLAKLAVWGEDRTQALARMRRALSDYAIGGICTNLAFLSRVVTHPEFADGSYDIGFVAKNLPELLREPSLDMEARRIVAAAAAVAAHERAEARARLGSRESRAPGLAPWVSAQRSELKW